jgi:protein tyrosine/serine phosphatase
MIVMPRSLPWLFGLTITSLLVGAPAWYAHYQQANYRNFRVVRADVLYRSGQLSLHGLQQIIRDYGIKTVITLRDTTRTGELPPDVAEENYCLLQDINYHRFPLRVWHEQGATVPAEENVRRFLEIMDEPKNQPVLVHCFAGSHRTGAFCAIYRMEYEHWTNADALDEMKEFGYVKLDEEEDILGFLTHYRPRWQQPASEAAEATGP